MLVFNHFHGFCHNSATAGHEKWILGNKKNTTLNLLFFNMYIVLLIIKHKERDC